MSDFQSFLINHKRIFREDLQRFAAGWKGDPGIPDFMEVWAEDSPVFPAFTSGSTGQPSRIWLQKTYALASARATIDFLDLSRGENILLSMPAAYIAGRMMMVRALVGEFNLLPVHPSAQPSIPNLPLELAAFTPHQFHNIVKARGDLRSLHIRSVLLGGAPVSQDLIDHIESFPGRIFETFGMTETYSHVAMRMRYPEDETYFNAVGPTTFSQSEGRLVVHAPHLGIEALSTNDVVNLKEYNRFEWLGRADNVINSGGIKIHPEVVEKKLASVIRQPCFVTSQPDPVYGQRVVLVIEKGVNDGESKRLLDRLNDILDKYEKPKSIVWVDTMVYTRTGKINRTATCQHYKI